MNARFLILGVISLCAANSAFAEIQMCIDKTVETKTDSQAPQLATVRGLMWENGRKIRVKFIGGNSFVVDKVKKYASEWEKYANIDLIFVNSGNDYVHMWYANAKGEFQVGSFDPW